MVRKKRLAGLEVVRAGCALVVLWSHVYGETLALPQNVLGTSISSFSLEAVAGFFVLSGCVISLQDYAGIGAYVRSRLVRILPIYYVVLAASALAMVGCGVAIGTGRLIANATFLQSLFWEEIFPIRFYIPSWSLAYEIYYYLAFVGLLLVPRLLMPLLVASVAVGAAMYAVPYQDGLLSAVLHALAYFSMWLAGVVVTRLHRAGHVASIQTGVYMLAVGICLSRVPLSEPAKFDYFRLAGFTLGFSFLIWALVSEQIVKPVRRLDLGLPARGAISAVTLIILWTLSTSHLDMKAMVSALLLFATLSPQLFVRGGSLALRPLEAVLVYVGGLSYALYLVHYPLVQTFNALALFRPVVNVAIVTALSFGLAHLLDYKFQPWIRVRLGSPPRGRSPATSAP